MSAAMNHNDTRETTVLLDDWLRRWQAEQAAAGTPVTLDLDPVPALTLTAIVSDSRAAQPGCAFIAVRGQRADGAAFAAAAVRRGAQVVLAAPREGRAGLEHLPVPVVLIPHLEQHLGSLAAAFYQHPARRLPVVGITGTNGKSSCAHFLAQAWPLCGRGEAGFIGTLGVGGPQAYRAGTHTTPDALTLQQELHHLQARGAALAALEVSSHALDQGRVSGTEFAAGVLTNLTRDHLDYHATMAAYGAAKARLFRAHPCALAVINIDDEFGAELADDLRQRPVAGQRVLRCSFRQSAAEVRGDLLDITRSGLHLALHTPWGSGDVRVAVLGRFQAANLLSVAAVLGGLGCDFDAVCRALSQLRAVPGRMQAVNTVAQQVTGQTANQAKGQAMDETAALQPLVLVDYAHTPDALEQALVTAREICAGQLWCVFGCGGDRDRGKRPQMGAVAARLADGLVITSDNPRSEDPDAIMRDIARGIPPPATTRASQTIVELADRAEAIAWAITRARPDDVVLVAGKGHENYQEVAGERRPFDDAACARRALERAA